MTIINDFLLFLFCYSIQLVITKAKFESVRLTIKVQKQILDESKISK